MRLILLWEEKLLIRNLRINTLLWILKLTVTYFLLQHLQIHDVPQINFLIILWYKSSKPQIKALLFFEVIENIIEVSFHCNEGYVLLHRSPISIYFVQLGFMKSFRSSILLCDFVSVFSENFEYNRQQLISDTWYSLIYDLWHVDDFEFDQHFSQNDSWNTSHRVIGPV